MRIEYQMMDDGDESRSDDGGRCCGSVGGCRGGDGDVLVVLGVGCCLLVVVVRVSSGVWPRRAPRLLAGFLVALICVYRNSLGSVRLHAARPTHSLVQASMQMSYSSTRSGHYNLEITYNRFRWIINGIKYPSHLKHTSPNKRNEPDATRLFYFSMTNKAKTDRFE